MAAVDGEESVKSLSAADPLLFLSPNPDLSRHARTAACHLYSSLLPICPKPKPPLDELITGDSFDAEQIWCQIDILSRPVVSMLRREVRRLERDPPTPAAAAVPMEKVQKEEDEEDEEVDDDEEERDEEDSDEEEEDEEEEEKEGSGVEDKFLKIKELEVYLEEDEEREFGEIKGKSKKAEDEDEEDEDDDNEVDLQFGDLDDDEDEDYAENATYGDFFGGKNKGEGSKKDEHKKEKRSSKKVEFRDEPEELDLDDEQKVDSDVDNQENGTLSTHEKQLLKIQSKIEQMEKANLEPKSWTMQGEVTVATRPQNSALEVDLDFEHNMRPPPATVESTASLEDLIKNRIIEGRFDDVQRAPALPSKAPKELKELDENKSKRGLAELYEEEYARQAGLASAPLSSSDEQKKEATSLFKRLCLKLDALSHFHFAPKPVTEDMSIQANVPALAMEEIAPVAVSDAAMLAPEEVFKGKGDIKEEAELTQEERKRRRANKKRKFRAKTANREAKKARQNAAPSHSNDTGNEDS